jgi:hypothetical protein
MIARTHAHTAHPNAPNIVISRNPIIVLLLSSGSRGRGRLSLSVLLRGGVVGRELVLGVVGAGPVAGELLLMAEDVLHGCSRRGGVDGRGDLVGVAGRAQVVDVEK